MLQAIAIDDEAPALAVITAHAAKVPFIQLQAVFLSPVEALAWLQSHTVDLIFSDIQMPDLFGTEFVRLAKSSGAMFAFVTAYPQYAIEGFQLQVLDYLLKPVELHRFIETCNRALQQKQAQNGQQNSIFVKDGHDWLRIQIADIEFIRSDTNLLFIHHAGQVTVTRMTISRLMELLPAREFVRVHKSYTVALKAVKKIERHQLTVGGALIPVARTYREEVERFLLG